MNSNSETADSLLGNGCEDPNVLSCADMITRVFTNIERKDIENSNKVFGAWRRTVESIRPNGLKLAAHAHIVDLKNGILLIEVDHPGWIQLLQLRQKYILTGLQRIVPDLHIQSLAFRLQGSAASLFDAASQKEKQNAQERERLQKRLDNEEKMLSERGFGAQSAVTASKSDTLPPELESIFSRFKKEMS